MPNHPLFAHFRQQQDLKTLIPKMLEMFPEWSELEVETLPFKPSKKNLDEYIDIITSLNERHQIKNMDELKELKGVIDSICKITLAPYFWFNIGALDDKTTMFWMEYTPVRKRNIVHSGQNPKSFLNNHENEIKKLLTHLVEGCGAELAYITWTDTKHHMISDSTNPFRLSERVDKLMASSKNILTDLVRSESTNFMWFLALKRELFDNEFEKHHRELEKKDFILTGKTESVAILENRVKATKQPDISTPLYEVYEDLGLITDKQNPLSESSQQSALT